MLSELKIWQRNTIILMFLISILFFIIGGILFGLVTIYWALPFWITSVVLFLITSIVWIIFYKIENK